MGEIAGLMFHRVLLNSRLRENVADHTGRSGALQDPDHKHTSSQNHHEPDELREAKLEKNPST